MFLLDNWFGHRHVLSFTVGHGCRHGKSQKSRCVDMAMYVTEYITDISLTVCMPKY